MKTPKKSTVKKVTPEFANRYTPIMKKGDPIMKKGGSVKKTTVPKAKMGGTKESLPKAQLGRDTKKGTTWGGKSVYGGDPDNAWAGRDSRLGGWPAERAARAARDAKTGVKKGITKAVTKAPISKKPIVKKSITKAKMGGTKKNC